MMKSLSAFLVLLLVAAFTTAMSPPMPVTQGGNPNPPVKPVKLIFIHHSTGENWLTDGYGDLGRTLAQNNYFVSDTNYGWGPDTIGDRTDIPNWTEWFRSENTPRTMQAVFTESGQNSSYTRAFGDPGGENQVIMFKSCFPNSALEGSPNDPPSPDGELTVGHAKYVYNELLKYFVTRPDKLFVVVTAPPLQDAAYSQNARAFNEWLLKDWLRENNYTQTNVAIFDFFTVLTGPGNHHRYLNGQVERTFQPGKNTSAYPSSPDDDHPSVAGSRKATEEFVPLLNFFYNRWKAAAPDVPPATENAPVSTQPSQPNTEQPSATASSLDNFDGDVSGWQPFDDGGGATTIACVPDAGRKHGGAQSMRLDFNVAANGWATCARFYDSPQNWSASQGIAFYLHAAQAGQLMHVDLYAGTGDARETYVYTVETPSDSASGWIPVQLRWEDFHRVAWEANADAPFSKTAQVAGLAFGIPTLQDAPSKGVLWVDDLALLGEVPAGEVETPVIAPPDATEAESTPAKPSRGLPGCGGAAALPLAVFGGLWLFNRKRR
jgi:hypothetical protein